MAVEFFQAGLQGVADAARAQRAVHRLAGGGLPRPRAGRLRPALRRRRTARRSVWAERQTVFQLRPLALVPSSSFFLFSSIILS
jgi:hypothetical protein